MQRIHEAAGDLKAAKAAPNRYRARLIEGDRWGSSGYYPAAVIERDGPTTWPAGTPVYLDHPGSSENFDRPERSVRDLAGKITSTPAMEADGLYADVEFYPHVAPIIEAMWGDVGMSIRASASVESGEAQGRRGQIIKELGEGVSVDVVTKAGAGGKLVSLLESARPTRGVTEAMAGDVHEWIQKALGPDRSLVDFDEDTAVWRDWSGSGEKFQAQDYTLDGATVTLTGEPREVQREQVFHAVNGEPSQADPEKKPVPPKAPAAGGDAKDSAPRGGDEPQKKSTRPQESEIPVHYQITEAQQRATEAEARAERLEAQLAEARAETRRTQAEAIVAEAFHGIEAPKGRARLVEAAASREDFDADAFRAEAQEAAAEYTTAGGVRGLGQTGTVNESATVDDVLGAWKN